LNSLAWFDWHMSLEPPPVPVLAGDEPFDGLDARILDFWRFAMSDLRTNNVRGYLAEFLVARAVGSSDVRVEWAPWDVTCPDGTRIEVKSAGYLEAWTQKKLSAPAFQVTPAYAWDALTGVSSMEQGYNADVYVFCLHTATAHDEYDPLQVAPWRFYVANQSTIAGLEGARIGVVTLERICGDPVTYPALSAAIAAAASSAPS
jgi:hypothetical protein